MKIFITESQYKLLSESSTHKDIDRDNIPDIEKLLVNFFQNIHNEFHLDEDTHQFIVDRFNEEIVKDFVWYVDTTIRRSRQTIKF